MTALAAIDDTSTAILPATYSNAVAAIERCEQVDECKEWTDKAAALASYARQAKDTTLLKLSQRIQGRAVRRAGQLLNQFDDRENQNSGAAPEHGTAFRKDVADAAGMSDHQRMTALAAANIPEDQFEAAIESDKPPTMKKLLSAGRKAKDEVKDAFSENEQKDPAAFRAGIQLRGDVRRLITRLKAPGASFERIFLVMPPDQIAAFGDDLGELGRLITAMAEDGRNVYTKRPDAANH